MRSLLQGTIRPCAAPTMFRNNAAVAALVFAAVHCTRQQSAEAGLEKPGSSFRHKVQLASSRDKASVCPCHVQVQVHTAVRQGLSAPDKASAQSTAYANTACAHLPGCTRGLSPEE